MKKITFLASSALLAFSAASFAEGFYIQGGGGVGFINSEIDDFGLINNNVTPGRTQAAVIRPDTGVGGAWTAGLGYMFNDSFGLEANYIGYSEDSNTKTKAQFINAAGDIYKAKLQANVYQINVLGVARTPFELGMGFFVKAKAGVGYTKQELEQTLPTVPANITAYKNSDDESRFHPVLSVGVEKELTDLFSLSVDYNAGIDSLVDNSSVMATIKLNPFDVMNGM